MSTRESIGYELRADAIAEDQQARLDAQQWDIGGETLRGDECDERFGDNHRPYRIRLPRSGLWEASCICPHETECSCRPCPVVAWYPPAFTDPESALDASVRLHEAAVGGDEE